jgi:hypothetical protein
VTRRVNSVFSTRLGGCLPNPNKKLKMNSTMTVSESSSPCRVLILGNPKVADALSLAFFLNFVFFGKRIEVHQFQQSNLQIHAWKHSHRGRTPT